MSKPVKYLTQAAMIAALYIALTYVSSAFGLAYGSIQFRLSEVLTVLPAFTPAAIPGLTIGCLIGNLGSPYGLVDIICGTSATLLAALCSYMLRKVCIKDIPYLAAIPPIFFNAVIVGLEITFLTMSGFAWAPFTTFALEVALGEVAMCVVLGIPFMILLKKNKELNRLVS